jgi:hypothetical protein
VSRAVAFRGQPLLLLGGLLAGWACLRIGMLQTSWDEPLRAAAAEMPESPRHAVAGGIEPLFANLRRLPQARHFGTPKASALSFRSRTRSSSFLPAVNASGAEAVTIGMNSPVPPSRGVPGAAPSLSSAGPIKPPNRPSRWSADAWLLLRDDGTTPLIAAGPTYGRSQAGAVLRYDLAPGSGVRPQAYLRASTAVDGARERQLAAGLSLRPVREVPLRVAAEARVIETASGTSLDPAVYAVSELPPVDLPMGMRGEAYLQGGYLAGRHATAFADGQVRAEKLLSRIGPAEFSVGGGAWGGAQKGSARLDIGPSATATFPLGEAYGRLAIDYRFRIAGDATPASGPVLTLSAGF